MAQVEGTASAKVLRPEQEFELFNQKGVNVAETAGVRDKSERSGVQIVRSFLATMKTLDLTQSWLGTMGKC